MTNKERLEINNAKIEEIRGILKNKILAFTDKNIIVELPEVFGTATKIYNFQVNENIIILASDVISSGLWMYKIDTKELKQIYNKGYNHSAFLSTYSGCFISNGYISAVAKLNIIYFDANDEICYEIPNTTGVSITATATMKIIRDKALVAISDIEEVVVYNYINKQVETRTVGYLASNVFQVDVNTYILYGGSAYISKYDYTTNNLELIFENSAGSISPIKLNDYTIIFIRGNGLVAMNFLSEEIKYSPSVDEETTLYYVGHPYDDFIIVRASGGLYVYNLTTNTFTKVYDTPYSTLVGVINKYAVLTNNTSSTAGILAINLETLEQAIPIYTSSYNWNLGYNVTDTKMVISGAIPAGGGSGLLLFDTETLQVTRITSSGKWTKGVIAGDALLLVGVNSSYEGIAEYKISTNQYSKHFSSVWFNKLTLDGNNCYIENTDKSVNKYIVYYEDASDKMIISKIVVEVE
jgi:hypothetical protein